VGHFVFTLYIVCTWRCSRTRVRLGLSRAGDPWTSLNRRRPGAGPCPPTCTSRPPVSAGCRSCHGAEPTDDRRSVLCVARRRRPTQFEPLSRTGGAACSVRSPPSAGTYNGRLGRRPPRNRRDSHSEQDANVAAVFLDNSPVAVTFKTFLDWITE